MNWIKRHMMGRYGSDQLSIALLILSLLLTFAANLLKFHSLILIGYIPLGICVFRMLSKNIQKRRMENYKFVMLVSPLYSKFLKEKKRIKDRKTYRYFKCKSCKTKLRVPKGKGKLIITCPKCMTRSTKHT